MPKTATIRLYQTGGTISMSKKGQGALTVDSNIQNGTVNVLNTFPYTKCVVIPVDIAGDSSDHPRYKHMGLVNTILDHVNEPGSEIIEHGTDTGNLLAAILALAGNEMYTDPLTLLMSIKDDSVPDSDVSENRITAGTFTRFADASGVFAVRPKGKIITSRHDAPGDYDWHARTISDSKNPFAQVFCLLVQ